MAASTVVEPADAISPGSQQQDMACALAHAAMAAKAASDRILRERITAGIYTPVFFRIRASLPGKRRAEAQ